MQDEHFIRQWTQVHGDFSAGLHNRLSHRGRYQRSRPGELRAIGHAYGQTKGDGPASLSPAARASLRGLAASVVTLVLWVTVMLVVTPAPGLAAPAGEAAPQASGCASPAMLA